MEKLTFSNLVVWAGTVVGNTNARDFETHMKREYDYDIKYVGEYLTLPDYGDSSGATGGRNDVLFYISDKDLPAFAIGRIKMGMKWWADFIVNSNDIIPEKIKQKYGDRKREMAEGAALKKKLMRN